MGVIKGVSKKTIQGSFIGAEILEFERSFDPFEIKIKLSTGVTYLIYKINPKNSQEICTVWSTNADFINHMNNAILDTVFKEAE